MDALAWGTAIESINRAMCLIMSQCASGWFCNSFLMTTTLSATTASIDNNNNNHKLWAIVYF